MQEMHIKFFFVVSNFVVSGYALEKRLIKNKSLEHLIVSTTEYFRTSPFIHTTLLFDAVLDACQKRNRWCL